MDERTEKLLRKSFQEIQSLRSALQEAKASHSEPIAIIGLACRVPGGIADPEAYWKLLDEAQDAVRPFPARWRSETVCDGDPDAFGKSYVREGGFLDDVDLFDSDFFGISPREAVQMDPQQRLLLEVTWEALERAGIPPATLNESNTGTYVGAMGSDYGLEEFSFQGLDGYRTTGVAGSVLSGRISYVLGLQGPSMTIDTACSSSLVSLHLACAGLRQRDCDLALAGGVLVMSTPSTFVEFSRLKALSSDGRCRSFASEANGTSWAEGCGVVVLKRLRDADRDGDRVLAVIRGSAVNQDGRSQGLTAPNGPSQKRVIEQAIEASRLVPSDIDAIEAHGTGTSLGDPIEANALADVFGPTRSRERPVWLGSSKSNFGHSQSAAGVLGVIKMVLALDHARLPKTLHADNPSEHIAWEGSGLALLQDAHDWPRSSERVRRAGVSSFGISGTNAHLILEEAPSTNVARAAERGVPVPLLVSGRDETALREQARRWAAWLDEHEEVSWRDVLRTAAVHRTHFESRAAISATNREESIEALRALSEGRSDGRVSMAGARSRRGAVFVFPGHGSQWRGMGRALLGESRAFSDAIDECERALRPHVDWSLRSVLEGAHEELVERVDVLQPVLFAMGVGLAAVWRSLGVEPAAVVGHSVGEISAAVVCGALSIEDGARLVAIRGRAIGGLVREGAMLHVQCPESETAERIARWSGSLSIAVLNEADSTVVSGDLASVSALQHELENEGVFARRVAIGFAAHSAHMDEALEGFRATIRGLESRGTSIPFFSTVTGHRLDGTALDEEYWCRNIRDVVRFDRAAAALVSDGYDVFIETGAHSVLGTPLSTAGAGRAAVVVGSLSRDRGGIEELYRNLGALHAAGVAVDWRSLIGDANGTLAPLPTYAFQRTRHWIESRQPAADVTSVGLAPTNHPLLGAMAQLASGDEILFSGRLSETGPSWLRDHGVFGVAVLPGTAFLDLALTAGRLVGNPVVEELAIEEALVLSRHGAILIQVRVAARDARGLRGFAIYSRSESAESSWKRHATGHVAPDERRAETDPDFEEWPPRAVSVDLSEAYARLAERGYEYGPSFRRLREAWTTGESIYARVVPSTDVASDAGEYAVHPASLDAALHALIVAGTNGDSGSVWLPFAWSNVTLHARGATDLRVKLTALRGEGEGDEVFALVATDSRGDLVLRAHLQLRSATAAQLKVSLGAPAEDMYVIEWRPAVLPETTKDQRALVIAMDDPLARALGVERCADVDALVARMDDGVPIPSVVLLDITPSVRETAALDPIRMTHLLAERALRSLQALLAEPRLNETALVWLSRSDSEGDSHLLTAPIVGLLRSARREHPDRDIRHIDLDGATVDSARLWKLLGARFEPELRERRGRASVPRLVRVASAQPVETAIDPEAAVLITGGLGELGRSLARHLVKRYGARHLILTSRSGADTKGASDIVASLEADGGESVRVVACDVTERAQLEALLSSIRSARPLGAVFHLAGALQDAPVTTLGAEALHRALRPKVDGALHLDALTRNDRLSVFALYSSAAGTVGTLGQGSYAAANTFLDALAVRRRRRGLPALSLAWGLWEQRGIGLTSNLSEADVARMRRQGIAPFTTETGLSLLDEALGRADATLVPLRLDLESLARELPSGVPMDALFRELWQTNRQRESTTRSSAPTVRSRISSLAPHDRLAAVLVVVRDEVAAVLRMTSGSAVAVDTPLRAMGLDSLMSLELRNKLSNKIGATLPATLAFNYPTPAAIAAYISDELEPETAALEMEWDDDAILAKLRTVSLEALKSSGLLEALMAQPDAPKSSAMSSGDPALGDILSAEDDSLVEMAIRMLQ